MSKIPCMALNHAISNKHLPRYLAEFEYCFNRRFDLASMLLRLIHASALSPYAAKVIESD
jgi:hypothetical protein